MAFALRSQLWKRLVYLGISFPLALLYFNVLVTGLATGLGLAITLLGLPVLVAMLFVWRGFAMLERALVSSLLGVDVEPPYRRAGPGLLRGLRDRLGDPATWKDLGYLLLLFPLSIAYFIVGVVLPVSCLGLVLAPAWYWSVPDGIDLGLLSVDTLPKALAVVPVGLAALLLSLRAADALGGGHAVLARTLLGPTHDPELTARVSDLRSSGARVVAAADAERRRLERDLHDGAQQRLVSLALTLGMARSRLPDDAAGAQGLIERAGGEAQAALAELRDLARGLHPAILTDRGLAPALADLAARSPVAVEVVEAPEERLPAHVEATAYFVVAEALTNVAKYAQASLATVAVRREGDEVVVEVADDGRGGADPRAGTGLRGLTDRVGVLDGRLEVLSPAGRGTRVVAVVPADGEDAPAPAAALVVPLGEHAPAAGAPLAAVGVPGSGGEAFQATAAHPHALAMRGLRIHVGVFGIVMAVLVVIWAITTAGYFWPIWPLLGWGAIVALHTWIVRPWGAAGARDDELRPRTGEASGEARPGSPAA
jgi:signal transduction histidine kinase